MRRLLSACSCVVLAGCASHERPEHPPRDTPNPPNEPAPSLASIVTQTLAEAGRTQDALIPADAQFVVRFDVKALRKSGPAGTLWQAILRSGDGEASRTIDDLLECDLDPDEVESITLAGAESRFAMTVSGIGVGNPELYRCVSRRAAKRGEDDDLQVVVGKGFTKLVGDDDELGILPDRNAVVVASDS